MNYNVKQKILLSTYPEIFIYSKITKLEEKDSKEINVNLKRKIKNWNMYNAKSAERILVYSIAVIELSRLGMCEKSKNKKLINKKLYGFIHEFEHNGELLYALELALCKDENEVKETRLKIASLNNTVEENVWVFYFNDQVNEDINKILYDKSCFLSAIVTDTHELMTFDNIPEYTEYKCLCKWATPIIPNKKENNGDTNE